MKQISLYRKYRPRHFNEVCGQELLIDLLKNSIINGKISHSYIFAGERGTGKTTTARIFAKAVNCLDLKQGEPCEQCENCLSVNNDTFMDIIEIDAASNNSVDEIRELRERVYYVPTRGRYKVYIIDEAHMITTQGFNAFLKTLEEPPEHVIFILATTEPEKILKTIHSRCQRFSFNKIDPLIIRKHVLQIAEKEGYHLHPDAAMNIALSADGSIRDSLTILQEVIFYSTGKEIDEKLVKHALGFITENEVNHIFELLKTSEKESELLGFTDQLFAQRITLDSVLNALFVRLSDLLKSPDTVSGKEKEGHFSLKQVVELSRYLMECRRNLKNIKDENIFLKIVFFDLYYIACQEKRLPGKEKKAPPVVDLPARKEKPEKPARPAEVKTEQEQIIVEEPVIIGKPDPEDDFEDSNEAGLNENTWNQLLVAVKNAFPLLHALMREAAHYEKKGNTVVVEFPEEMKFHKTSLDKAENKIKIKKVFSSYFNSDIEPVFRNQGVKSTENWKEDETEELLEQARNMPAVKNIMKLFGGGKVVSVKKIESSEDNEDE